MYKTLDEALQAKIDLTEKIQGIDSQLASRASQVVGHVPDEVYKDYMEWKSRACAAKARYVNKLQRTKKFIQDQRIEGAKERNTNRGGAEGLLTDLYGVVKTMVSDGVEIDHEEQQLLDDVASHIENKESN